MTPRMAKVIGVVNGVNLDFATPSPYVSGSLRAFLNGRLVTQWLDDGFNEVDPSAGTFRMKVAPIAGDTLYGFYEEV